MVNSNLAEITKIITNNNEKFISDMAEMSNDFYAFYSKHKKWFHVNLDYSDRDFENDIDCGTLECFKKEVFVFWLERRDADKNQFASHIDWKESPEEIIQQLDYINKNLGYPLNIKELKIDEEENTFEALKIINTHFNTKGFSLVGLDSGGDCYYLFIILAKEFDRLQELGAEIDFEFFTFE